MPENPETWPNELDALVAAPKHHRLLMENDSVRVLETRIEPGETTAMHTHRWPAAYYVLAWGQFVRRNERGEVTMDTRGKEMAIGPGQAIWAQPLEPHTLENVGDGPIHIVSVEVKPQHS